MKIRQKLKMFLNVGRNLGIPLNIAGNKAKKLPETPELENVFVKREMNSQVTCYIGNSQPVDLPVSPRDTACKR